MKVPFLTLSILLPLFAYGQFKDDFSDGDISQNPTWVLDTSFFEVDTNEELHLIGPSITSKEAISTSCKAIENAVWELDLFMDFAPSGNNYTEIHLTSGSGNIKGPHDGYFVRIGDTDDDISLYRRTGGLTKKIIDGKDGRVDSDPVRLSLKVSRSVNGLWEVLSDTTGGSKYQLEGSTVDTAHKASAYFGILCAHTSTRSDKFYFDSITVSGSPYIDSMPPRLDTITTWNAGEVTLRFSEPMDTSMGNDLSRYTLKGIGNPLFADHPSLYPNSVNLEFPTWIPNDTVYTIQVHPAIDTSGNVTDTLSGSFYYGIPDTAKKGAVLINEVMADPTPSRGLPKVEYVELFIKEDILVDFQGWGLSDGSSTGYLPNGKYAEGDHIILCEQGAAPAFPNKKVIGVPGFPNLNNSGDPIRIFNANGNTIDSIHYHREWFRDPPKEKGGWSLERVDPSTPCRGRMNWKGSVSDKGGTPGVENSVHDPQPDTIPPFARKAVARSDRNVRIWMSEPVDKGFLSPSQFSITPSRTIDSLHTSPSNMEISIFLSPSLDTGKWYVLTLDSIRDCPHNLKHPGDTLRVVLPDQAEEKDVVINEILFDPYPDGVDMVEIMNRSDRILDLQNWELAHLEDSVEDKESISEESRLFLPGEYLFLSTDPSNIRSFYPESRMRNSLAMGDLPTYWNDSGTVVLLSGSGNLIDNVHYKEEMHHSFIRDPEGISLERVRPDGPSNDPSNWHSASSHVDYATPGYRNSQFFSSDKQDRFFNLPYHVFTPNNDGERDLLLLSYELSKPGSTGSIRIFSASGREVRNLAENELFGREGEFIWDGTKEDGTMAPVGAYILLIELIHPSGEKIREKLPCVLGKDLNQ